MIIEIDKNGYVSSYALIGTLTDGIEVSEPDNMEHFEMFFAAYRYANNRLIFDTDQKSALEKADQIQEITKRRDAECFPIINRGRLWYNNLTNEQLSELNLWYQCWLEATETLSIPKKPEWLK